MNTKKTLKSFLKTLPLLSILTTGLALAPTAIYADDNAYNKHKYSQNRDKAHNNRNNNQGRSYDKRHKSYNDKPKYHRNNWRGYNVEHGYIRRTHRTQRPNHQPVYIVNEHRYNNYVNLDRLGFMFGLRTGNFDIIYRD